MIQSIPSAAGAAPGGAVGGASNLTTVGAIPYVSSSGVLNQDATKLFWDSANGRLGVGTASPSSTLTIAGITGVTSGGATPPSGIAGLWLNYTGNTSTIQSVASGSSGKALVMSGYPLIFQDSQSGAESARFAVTSQNLLIGGATDGNYKLDVQKSGSTGTLRVYDQTATTGSTLAVIRAGAGQSGNLVEFQGSGGSALAYVDSSGTIYSGGRLQSGGDIKISAFGLLISNPADGIMLLRNNLGTDFNRIQFGGTTSSFPALRRTNAELDVVLADNSAWTVIHAGRVRTEPGLVSALPAAGVTNAGSIAYVTDANATTIGSTVAGGGANKVMVWSDGTNWKIYAS